MHEIILSNKVILCLVIVFAYLPVTLVSKYDQTLNVWFLDVGQGDSILIRTPSLKYILIDCGKGDLILDALSNVIPYPDSTIDMVLLTHPDTDHVGGFAALTKRYKVNTVIFDDKFKNKPEMGEIINYIGNNNAQNVSLRFPDKILIDDVIIEIMWQNPKLTEENLVDNDLSLVLKLTYYKFSILLTGDISYDILERLSKLYDYSDISILKASHHGSKTGTSNELLKAIGGGVVVFSAGKNNPYHHPSEQVLEMVDQYNYHSLRTDLQGTIHFSCDKSTCQIER